MSASETTDFFIDSFRNWFIGLNHSRGLFYVLVRLSKNECSILADKLAVVRKDLLDLHEENNNLTRKLESAEDRLDLEKETTRIDKSALEKRCATLEAEVNKLWLEASEAKTEGIILGHLMAQLSVPECAKMARAPAPQTTESTPENIFGKQRGRFDETMASRVQRSLYDEMRGAFAAMTAEQKLDACFRFTEEFAHPYRHIKFSLCVMSQPATPVAEAGQ